MNTVKLTIKVEKNLGAINNYNDEIIFALLGSCKRLSGVDDILKITYSSIIHGEIDKGFYFITGELRRTKSGVYVYATNIEDLDEQPKEYVNYVELSGIINKPLVHRKTVKSDNNITDLSIKVMRNSIKSDTLNCIVWGKYSIYCKNLSEGDKVHIIGRLQSRLNNGKLNIEVSCTSISKTE